MFPYPVQITCPTDYYLRIFYYDNREFSRLIPWTRNHTVPANQQFRIVVRAYPEDTTVVLDIDTVAAAIAITRTDYLDGTGMTVYNGDPINLLTDFSKQHRCNIQRWKDFINTDDAWKLYNAQSIEIFGDEMFIFTSSGVVDVMSMLTKEITATFTMPDALHYNTLQFSDIYYDPADKYPLLFNGSTECIVYRITYVNGVYAATRINTINAPFVSYGMYTALDNVNRIMYVASYTTGGYSVYENNPVVIYTVKIPDDDAVKSGTPVTLTENDTLSKSEIQHTTLQDMKGYRGVLFIANTNEPETTPRQFVWVFDRERGLIQTIIRLAVNLEVEGIAISDGILYASQRRGANAGNDNPLMIYSLDF